MKITENTTIPIKSILVIVVFCVWLAKIEARDEKYRQQFSYLDSHIVFLENARATEIKELKEITWKQIERIFDRLDDISKRLARIEGALEKPRQSKSK